MERRSVADYLMWTAVLGFAVVAGLMIFDDQIDYVLSTYKEVKNRVHELDEGGLYEIGKQWQEAIRDLCEKHPSIFITVWTEFTDGYDSVNK